jgi:hypothetical protein
MDWDRLVVAVQRASVTLQAHSLGEDVYGQHYAAIRTRGTRCAEGTGERFDYTVCTARHHGQDHRARLPKYRAWVFGQVEGTEDAVYGDPRQTMVSFLLLFILVLFFGLMLFSRALW